MSHAVHTIDCNVHMDLNDPDEVEYQLIDLAQQMIMTKDANEVLIATGTVLREFAPSLANALKANRKRHLGAGNFMNGFCNAIAILTSICVNGVVKNGHEEEAVDELTETLNKSLKYHFAKSRLLTEEESAEAEKHGLDFRVRTPEVL